MQTTYVYDYELVDSIRQQEKQYQAALDKAKESVRLLAASVQRLKESRLAMEATVDDSETLMGDPNQARWLCNLWLL